MHAEIFLLQYCEWDKNMYKKASELYVSDLLHLNFSMYRYHLRVLFQYTITKFCFFLSRASNTKKCEMKKNFLCMRISFFIFSEKKKRNIKSGTFLYIYGFSVIICCRLPKQTFFHAFQGHFSRIFVSMLNT